MVPPTFPLRCKMGHLVENRWVAFDYQPTEQATLNVMQLGHQVDCLYILPACFAFVQPQQLHLLCELSTFFACVFRGGWEGVQEVVHILLLLLDITSEQACAEPTYNQAGQIHVYALYLTIYSKSPLLRVPSVPGLFSSFFWEQGIDKVRGSSRSLKLFEGFNVQFWETGPWAPPPTFKSSRCMFMNNYRGKKGAGTGPCHHCRAVKGEPSGASAALYKSLAVQICGTRLVL